jgi:hypothetical protein
MTVVKKEKRITLMKKLWHGLDMLGPNITHFGGTTIVYAVQQFNSWNDHIMSLE